MSAGFFTNVVIGAFCPAKKLEPVNSASWFSASRFFFTILSYLLRSPGRFTKWLDSRSKIAFWVPIQSARKFGLEYTKLFSFMQRDSIIWRIFCTGCGFTIR